MLYVGDRVELIEDVNNYPGIIPKGSRGRITNYYKNPVQDIFYVQFDNLSSEFCRVADVDPYDRMPMYEEELRLI